MGMPSFYVYVLLGKTSCIVIRCHVDLVVCLCVGASRRLEMRGAKTETSITLLLRAQQRTRSGEVLLYTRLKALSCGSLWVDKFAELHILRAGS